MKSVSEYISELVTFHKTVLDIGTGPHMETLVSLLKKNPQIEKVVGIDKTEKASNFYNWLAKSFEISNSDAIKIVRKKIFYLQHNLQDGIPIEEHFDVIILSHILHFFASPTRKKILHWCTTHLTTNGILFIRVNHSKNLNIITQATKTQIINDELNYSDGSGKNYFLLEEKDFDWLNYELIKHEKSPARTNEHITLVFVKN